VSDREPGPHERAGSNAVLRWLRSIKPQPDELKGDLVAGLPGAIGSVPDGMAASILAGVNPIHGLYASFAGPIAGGLSSSTRLMLITTTGAAALAAGSTLAKVDSSDRASALFLLTLIAGVAMVLAGLFHLGRYTRFVTHSVMIGFLTGVAVNIILGQLPDLFGVSSTGSIAIEKAWNVLIHPREWQLASLFVGLAALAILYVLGRTRAALVSAVFALILPTIAVVVFGLDDVARVADTGTIASGLPVPGIPRLSLLTPSLLAGALAVAAIVLVQGAGVAESAPNRDGSFSDANRDFVAQGVGNVASSLFKGQPVGGSVGQTALNIAAGARSRWASILRGVWMVVILLLFSGLVGKVAMPTLAAVLIFAAIGAIRPAQVLTIWRTGPTSQVAMATTFLATLLLPVTAAVGIGVALSLLLQLNREALDLAVVEMVPHEGGRVEERPAPATLRSGEVVVLDVYGSLFYAGARTLQARLPDPTGTHQPGVVLRLRGRSTFGATFFVILADYAKRIADVGGTLVLSGVGEDAAAQLRRTRVADAGGHIQVFPATPVLGESTRAAYAEAQEWLLVHREGPPHTP
jgi:SulP family sulfate permease